MTISSLIGSRLLYGIAAFALTGSLVGATAVAAEPDNPVRELRHDVRDASKAQREEIEQLRREFAAEYAKQRPDTAKLERLHAEIEARRTAIADMRFDALIKMHDELDAQQREKLAERMAGKGKSKRGDGAKGKGKKPKDHESAKRDRPERPDAAVKARKLEARSGKAKQAKQAKQAKKHAADEVSA